MARMEDGRAIKILTLIDECTRESLAIHGAPRIRAHDVTELLADVMIQRGIPNTYAPTMGHRCSQGV